MDIESLIGLRVRVSVATGPLTGMLRDAKIEKNGHLHSLVIDADVMRVDVDGHRRLADPEPTYVPGAAVCAIALVTP